MQADMWRTWIYRAKASGRSESPWQSIFFGLSPKNGAQPCLSRSSDLRQSGDIRSISDSHCQISHPGLWEDRANSSPQETPCRPFKWWLCQELNRSWWGETLSGLFVFLPQVFVLRWGTVWQRIWLVIYIYLHINTKSDTFFYITIIAALVCGTDDDDDGFNAVHWEVGRATRKTLPPSPAPAESSAACHIIILIVLVLVLIVLVVNSIRNLMVMYSCM